MRKFILPLILWIVSAGLTAAQVRAVRYSGQPVSIDFEGDIRDFVQKIASISGLEIRVAAEVSRTVTVHLKDVPWDLALDTVLKNSGLGREADGKILSVAAANPIRGGNRLLMGTISIEGTLTSFQLQNPRTVLQVDAPAADGKTQNWRIEWESADDLAQTGIRQNMLKTGEQVFVSGNLIRPNTLRLVVVARPSDGFYWGDTNAFSSSASTGTMFVSSVSK